MAATLSGCSTFGVAPFPEPIRPPIEAEGEDAPAPQAQAEEASRYSPTPGCTSPEPKRAAWRTTSARTLRARSSRPPSMASHRTLH
ncbi:MAG: hypothetical protein OXF68_15300 [Gammaproteobacteria bacterium]|nr:hypothetical protein [Gammaproteobacteria bacterium]